MMGNVRLIAVMDACECCRWVCLASPARTMARARGKRNEKPLTAPCFHSRPDAIFNFAVNALPAHHSLPHSVIPGLVPGIQGRKRMSPLPWIAGTGVQSGQ
jgi:hypothetical protein